MSDIFISYSRHDQEWVGKFAKALEDAGYSIWWDTRLLAGDEFHDVIPAALEQASCVIVVWSKVSVTRKWVRAEASRAHDKEVLIPIQIESVPIPMPFNLLQAENMQQWNGKRNHPAFQRLVTSIDRYCRATPVAQTLSAIEPESKPSLPKIHSRSWLIGLGGLLAIGLSVVSVNYDIRELIKLQPPTSKAEPTVSKELNVPEATTSSQLADAALPIVQPPTTSPTRPASPTNTRLPFEPMMVDIPAGSFTMGCVEGRDDVEGGCSNDEKPAHQVSLSAFQIGKYEVTFDEWDACEQAKACPHAEDAGWGRGKRPVINVSWNDITQNYIPWLNQQTGKHYRLPTEAEWEYAARAGGESAYPWGNSVSCSHADYWLDDKSCHGKGTSEVGRFVGNNVGLHDTAGNVWEWVQDGYEADYYRSSPASAPQWPYSGSSRVLRGGSWYNYGRLLRSSSRYDDSHDSRNYGIGFRLALG